MPHYLPTGNLIDNEVTKEGRVILKKKTISNTRDDIKLGHLLQCDLEHQREKNRKSKKILLRSEKKQLKYNVFRVSD